jgi:hypothetical protein
MLIQHGDKREGKDTCDLHPRLGTRLLVKHQKPIRRLFSSMLPEVFRTGHGVDGEHQVCNDPRKQINHDGIRLEEILKNGIDEEEDQSYLQTACI